MADRVKCRDIRIKRGSGDIVGAQSVQFLTSEGWSTGFATMLDETDEVMVRLYPPTDTLSE